MRKIVKKIRSKFHTDLVILLENILRKLENNSKSQMRQHQEIENKIKIIEKNTEEIIQSECHLETLERINTIENNIQSLQQSINEDFIVMEDIRQKVYRGDWEAKQNIKQYLHQVAGLQTAEYIIKNMPRVSTFNATLDILTFALSKVTLNSLYLEFGVFSGKTINHIANQVTKQTIYGFDSFEGLPEDWRTGFLEGTFKKDNLPDVKENVRLVKGWFNETLPDFIQEHTEKCAFIHIDCDLYSSTKCVFDILKDRIQSGTIIVFDEYFNYPDWQNGEYKALQEFIRENSFKYEYIGYVEIMEQVAIRIL